METEFFAGLLVPQRDVTEDENWRDLLASDLLQPRFNMTLWEAMSRRLRRNYSWIFIVLVLSWMIKVAIHPTPTTDFVTLLERAAIGPVPGTAVLLTGVVFNMALFFLALSTLGYVRRFRGDSEVSSRTETRELMGSGLRNWWE